MMRHVKGEDSFPAGGTRRWPPRTQPLTPSFHIEPLEPGDPVPNVAHWLGRVGVEAALSPALVTRALLRFSGPYTPIGEPDVETQSYAVVDLGASFTSPARRGARPRAAEHARRKYPEIRASGLSQSRRPPHAPRGAPVRRAAVTAAARPASLPFMRKM